MQKIVFILIVSISTLWSNFNFGECSGSGTFEQQIVHYANDYENTTLVGQIPQGIEGLRIELISDKDVDIRLYGENEDKIVHWPYGLLSHSYQQTEPYKDVPVTYSGYNGVDKEKGHEFIEVNGTTPTAMTMKAFGYKAGYATVNYSWTGKVGCTSSDNGTGSFTQALQKDTTSLVGTIPPNVNNVQINLTSDKDLDIQLYGADGTAIASWKPMGLMAGPIKQSTMYHGMNITWSGYNGTDGQAGHEYIKIAGNTTEVLVMKVFGYEAGSADVTYSWGDSENNRTTPDITKPVITLVGDKNITLNVGDTYSDAGATANDDEDGNITANIHVIGLPINTSVAGNYIITYTVSDTAGNTADAVSRTVIVKPENNGEGNNTSPVICENNHTWELDFNTDPTTQNWDYIRDQEVTFDVSKLSNGVWKAANWDLLDTTPDFAFNQPTSMKVKMKNTSVGGKGAVAWINVESTDEKTAALYLSLMQKENGTQTLKLMNADVELAKFIGLSTGMIEVFISVEPDTDSVKIWVENEYKGSFKYTRTSWEKVNPFATILAWGSTAEFEYVKIHSCANGVETPEVTEIKDTTKPIITLVGENDITIYKDEVYEDVGATANDNLDGDITNNIETISNVDTSTVGTYHVTYNVHDAAGNSADEVVRTVHVIEDTIKPIITFIGNSSISIEQSKKYIDAGATANDNLDGDITSKIVTTGDVDTSTLGTYEIKYNVSDEAGNKADEVVRTVKVTKTEKPTSGTILIDGSSTKYTQLQDALNDAKDGDTISLGKGTYEAGVVIDKNNLTIKAADGEKSVVLSGDKLVTNWQYDSSRELYYAPSPCSDVQMLFINGEEKKAARYPNSGYLFIKDSPSKSKFSLKNFNLTNDDIKDAEAHIRMSSWRLASRRVASYEDDYINLTSEAISDYNDITPQYKVFFTQVIAAIDANEEWAWNNNKIYMKSDSEPQDVSVACSEYGIHLGAGAKRVTIDGLKITKIKGNGIDKDNDTRKSANDDLIIKDNTISYVSGWGIILRDFYKQYERLPADTLIQSNEVHHTRTGGIKVFADNAVVDSNYVHDIGASKLDDDVLAFGDNFMLSGIFIADSSGAKVIHNRVDNTGYNGISLSNFWHGWTSNDSRIVELNYVSNAMLALNDGACIYAHIQKEHDVDRGVEPGRDTIRNNIVQNCIGSYAGVNHPDLVHRAGEGIYLDDASSHVDVYGNTVIDATKSFFTNRGNYEITVKNNTFISPDTANIYIAERDGKKKQNVFINNNKVFSGSKWAYQLILDVGVEDLLMQVNSNIFRVNSSVDVKYGYGTYVETDSFDKWKNNGYDNDSAVIQDSTKPVVLINPSLNSVTFDNLEGCKKFDNTPLDTTSSTVEPYESLVLFGCDTYVEGTYKTSL